MRNYHLFWVIAYSVDTIFIAYYYYINHWYDKWCSTNGSSLHLNGIVWNLAHIFSQKLPPNSWFMKNILNMYALCQRCIIENLFNMEKGFTYARNSTSCDRSSKFVFNKSLWGAIISNSIPLKVKLYNQYYQ